MRRRGNSIKNIESRLKIPRSTLSGWFKKIILTDKQKRTLHNKSQISLIKARKQAVKWHNRQKLLRIRRAEKEASEVLGNIDVEDKNILELSLAMLYLGEGDKTSSTSMGSSNPLITKFFINSLHKLFNITKSQIKCELHLRSDQDSNKMIRFWSKKLNLPLTSFTYYKDKRTVKSKTYPTYRGVCVVRCGKIAIQRRLVQLSQKFCKITLTDP